MRNWFFEQLAMYAAYHRDIRNQLTHHVGVPMIVFSLIVAASTVPLLALEAGVITLATALMTVLLLLYIIGSPLVGTIAVIIYGTLLFFGEKIALQGTENALWVALALFVLGWIIQFIGHIFEGRKPALFDNALQIFMAPAFLIAEVLFLMGLEKGLKAEIEARMPAFMPNADNS